ncbi:MAG: alpha/beta fold hydrolase [Hyphomicrobiales bacterium]
MSVKPLIVFIHGIGGAGAAWVSQEEHFGARYDVLSWNVPGYGGAPMLDEMSFENIATALVNELDARDAAKAIIVGHSFGGMIAQAVVHHFPERVAKLVLCGTSSAFGRPDGEFQKKFVADRLAPLNAGKTLADIAPAVMRGFAGDEHDEQGFQLGVKCMGEVPEATYRTALELIVKFDMRGALNEISCPTLVIAGERDTAAPAPMMERMVARVKDAQYKELPGCGHLMPLEQPKQFNSVLDSFLEETADA